MSMTHVPDPDQSREAARALRRKALQERFERLADCKTSRDPKVIDAFHDHLASSGLRDCGSCGVRFDAAAPDPGRPFTREEAPTGGRVAAVARRILWSLKGFLHPRLAFSLGTALMGAVLLVTGFPHYALVYLGLSLAGCLVVAALRRAGI
jgi:hypothetical protein